MPHRPTERPPSDPPTIPGAERRQVVAGGLRVNYAESGSGPPLLLLHGWPGHHYLWHRLIPDLSRDFRVIAPDLRGFGQTEAPGSGHDGETFARDQVALLEVLEIERANVIGHDWGGWTTLMLGLLHPARVERLIVLNAPHPWSEPSPKAARQALMSWYGLLNATPVLGPFLHRRTPWISYNLRRSTGGAIPEDEIAMYAESFRDPERARAVSHLYRYYLRTFGQSLAGHWNSTKLAAPTRLLFGEDDVFISPELLRGDAHRRHSDDMEIEFVPGCGHFIADERPELVAAAAREHFGAAA